MVLSLPMVPNFKGVWFTLKEGSPYRLKFSFSVSNNIVSGLRYTNTFWKTGVKVDRNKEMLGTFSPQVDPYVYEAPEGTTPSGIFARGSYSARSKVGPVYHMYFQGLRLFNNSSTFLRSSIKCLGDFFE
ncbi:rho GDP-dissociation inhibitor 1 isoform X3 [Iris pallida]|uniref:Rho GDP-dissociation inhibitor 1 isoform X3 n=1 Tax=Iris pallida TaxID=29817 RepID=A0AAX6HU42_IRIPA|nr:rho GDP-dissociation inhibitor 1 isoform X3 [Iris pallida]KAJ6844004.1 rho GDP-dissociation inhibitor 1 isoform X3 [Iris pallida]